VGKGGQCIEIKTLPTLCSDCLEIWEPESPGTLTACLGITLNFIKEWTILGSNLVRTIEFSLLPNVQNGSGPKQPHVKRAVSFFPGGTEAGG